MIDVAKSVFEIEISGLNEVKNNLSDNFPKAIDIIIKSQGKVIMVGMGKSGIIAKKIAATLASTGTPSFFMHPSEAYHGDLGMIESKDVVVLISYSGETNEVLKLIPYLNENKNKTISITGNGQSTLALNTDVHLNIAVTKEACPLQLAPTTSTTATLVMGDAIAVALMKERNFAENNFARFHPGGSLGRRLLVKVCDLMKVDDLPILTPNSGLKDVISEMTAGKLGLVVIALDKKILGVISDGDLRRQLNKNLSEIERLKAKDIMTDSPVVISPDCRIVEAESIMQQKKINTLLVAQNGLLEGIIQIYDLT